MAKRIAKFHKVSLNQFEKDWIKTFGNQGNDIITEIYNDIELPERSTSGSAGYDFKSPKNIVLQPGDSIVIPTGVRCKIDEDWVLKCYPRSGQGFKYKVRLSNTVGIIDSDYFYSDNEGHIMVKLSNENTEGKVLEIEKGKGFCQGIFVEYGITVDDDVKNTRNGGFGSTDK